MSNESTAKSGGMSAIGLLGVVFVTLKLLGITAVADWSWWWVTAPFWGGFALVIVFFIVGAIGIVIIEGIKALRK